MVQIADLVGLNKASVLDLPLVRTPADIDRVWADGVHRLSLAGARGSQGGHTSLDGGRMLLTETLTRPIVVDSDGFDPLRPQDAGLHRPSLTVPAGASWSEVHHALAPFGLAPLVHQSSAHFSVGGSLSVNCHGRDPRQGPLSSVVNWIEVWRPDGSAVRASAGDHPELFRAALGGYGSVGPILRANLSVGPNRMLWQTGWQATPHRYAEHLQQLLAPGALAETVHLHYGWLRCTGLDQLFDEVLVVDYKDQQAPTAVCDTDLKVEAWGTTELLRAGWAAARQAYSPLRDDVWEQLVRQQQSGSDSRLNWMRAPIGFTSHRSPSEADILQEYFVPAEHFLSMLDMLRAIFQEAEVNVLSTTVRLVRPDQLPVNLAWCADGPTVCFAADVSIPVVDGAPAPGVAAWVARAQAAAMSLGGSFYLPYWRFAPAERVRKAYGEGWRRQADAITRFNPDRRWWNAFLEAYF